jgi:hypothetical protein
MLSGSQSPIPSFAFPSHAASLTLNPNPRALPSIPQNPAEIVMASGSSDAGNVSPSPASILLDKEAHIAFSRNHTTARAKRLGSEHTHHSPPLAQLISTCSPPPPPRAPPGGRNWLLVLVWPRIAARCSISVAWIL